MTGRRRSDLLNCPERISYPPPPPFFCSAYILSTNACSIKQGGGRILPWKTISSHANPVPVMLKFLITQGYWTGGRVRRIYALLKTCGKKGRGICLKRENCSVQWLDMGEGCERAVKLHEPICCINRNIKSDIITLFFSSLIW